MRDQLVVKKSRTGWAIQAVQGRRCVVCVVVCLSLMVIQNLAVAKTSSSKQSLNGGANSSTHKQEGKTPACQFYFKKEKLCAGMTWVKKPVVVELPTEKDQAEFTLNFWNPKSGSEKGPFVDAPGQVKVSLWMPDMDHGSEPTVVHHDEKQAGVYHVSHVLFSMGGNWEIRVSLLRGDKILDRAQAKYRLE